MTTPDPAAAPRRDPIEIFRSFLSEHPELVGTIADIAATAAAGPPVPLTFYGVIRELISASRLAIDDERRAQMMAAVDEHEQQHEQNSGATSPAPGSAPSSAPPTSSALGLDSDPAGYGTPGA